jgi:hypothetical protein
MEASLPLNRRAALKLGLGGGIGGLFGFASARAEDRTSEQQRPGTNVNRGPRTDPPPLVDARFPCEIVEDVWVIPDRRIFLVPNIGIVVGKEAALVIDCGLGESGPSRDRASVANLQPRFRGVGWASCQRGPVGSRQP